jgi:hypothetical protein
MKNLTDGSILAIPLLKGMGFAYAKFLDLTKLEKKPLFPDLIKVFNYRTSVKEFSIEVISDNKYLINPMLVAGLRPTLKMRNWEIVGSAPKSADDFVIPNFKSGNLTMEEAENGEWFIHKDLQTRGERCEYEIVKFLQPYTAIATGNLELRLTMYFIIQDGLKVEDFFDLHDDRNKWNYKQVVESPAII